MTGKLNDDTTANDKEWLPALEFVQIFFQQQDFDCAEADLFYNFYASRNWKNNDGSIIRNWKTVARKWMWQRKKLQRFCLDMLSVPSVRYLKRNEAEK